MSPVRPARLRGPVTRIYAVLLLANLAAWAWAVLVFRHQPVLLGTALLAYGFGLRHAVDADHIAAIDNVTRKLMQEGKRPVTVGFFSPWAIRRWSSSWRRPSPRRQIRLRIISTR